MLESVSDWTLEPILMGVPPAIEAGETPVYIGMRHIANTLALALIEIDLQPLCDAYNIKTIQTIFIDLYGFSSGFRWRFTDVDTGNRVSVRGFKTVYHPFKLAQSKKVRIELCNSSYQLVTSNAPMRFGFLNVPIPAIQWDN